MIIYSRPKPKNIIEEGNADLRLLHLYNDFKLSLTDIKNILNVIDDGTFVGTEKIDGYNLKVTYRNQEVFVARNKKEIEDGGLNLDGLLARSFKGGKEVKESFIKAYQVLEELFVGLPEREVTKAFPQDQNFWLNCEVVSDDNNNFLKYGKDWIIFHAAGSSFYEVHSGKKLSGVNYMPFFDHFVSLIKDKKVETFSFRETPEFKFTKSIDKKVWDEIKIIEEIYSIAEIPEDQSFKELAQKISPSASADETKEILKPVIESLFTICALLVNREDSSLTQNNSQSVRDSKNLLLKAIKAAKTYDGDNEKVKSVFEKNMKLLKTPSNFVSSLEGVVFNYGGKFYKITGYFSSANQIVGLYTMGTGKSGPIQSLEEDIIGGWTDAGSNIIPDQAENLDGRVTYLYPGSFKPPHLGHFDVMQNILNSQVKFKVNKFIVVISKKAKSTARNSIEIDAETSKYMWEIFTRNFENVEIRVSQFDTPIKDIYEFIENESEQNDKIYIVKSEKDKEDKRFDKIEEFARSKDKNISIREAIASEVRGVSSTIVRDALDSYNPGAIFDYMPAMSREEKNDIWDKIFKKKDTRNSPDGYTVLTEIAPHSSKKVYDFIDSLKLLDKAQWIGKLSYNHIFDERTRLVVPLKGAQTIESFERLNEICFNCGWLLNLGQGVVTKEIEGRPFKFRIGKYINKLISIAGALSNFSNLSKSKKEKSMKDLLLFSDFDVEEFKNQFGDYMEFISELTKINEEYSATREDDFNRYSVVLSRHPIDIARMGDHTTMKTCFGDEHDKLHCAIEDARVNGLVSYIVLSNNLETFDLDSPKFQEDEIFTDPDRGIKGIVPLSRIRILRIVNDKNFFELAIPETKVYGKFRSEHYETIKKFLTAAQDSYIYESNSEDKLNPEYLRFTGGIYLDTKLETLVDSYFDTDRFTKSKVKIQHPNYDYENLQAYVFGEASKWINRRRPHLKYNKEYITDVGFIINTIPNDGKADEFIPQLSFEIRIPFGKLELRQDIKEHLLNLFKSLGDDIELVNKRSDGNIMNGMLILELTAHIISESGILTSGFDQVHKLENLLYSVSKFLDKSNFREKLLKTSQKSNIEDIDVTEIETGSIKILWKEKFHFKKFIVPVDFDPVFEDNRILISSNLLGITQNYKIYISNIDFIKYTGDYTNFAEVMRKSSNNQIIGDFNVSVECSGEDFNVVKDALSENISSISSKFSKYLQTSLAEVETSAAYEFVDSLVDQMEDFTEDTPELEYLTELMFSFIEFYDLNSNNSEFTY